MEQAYPRITIDKLNDEGIVRLLKTFVKYVCDEYKSARHVFKANPRDKKNAEAFYNVKDFIMSGYFEDLTTLNGKTVIELLEKECKGVA